MSILQRNQPPLSFGHLANNLCLNPRHRHRHLTFYLLPFRSHPAHNSCHPATNYFYKVLGNFLSYCLFWLACSHQVHSAWLQNLCVIITTGMTIEKQLSSPDKLASADTRYLARPEWDAVCITGQDFWQHTTQLKVLARMAKNLPRLHPRCRTLTFNFCYSTPLCYLTSLLFCYVAAFKYFLLCYWEVLKRT